MTTTTTHRTVNPQVAVIPVQISSDLEQGIIGKEMQHA